VAGKAHVSHTTVLQSQIEPNVIPTDGVIFFARNIERLQRAVIARVLIVVKNHFSIKVFHSGSPPLDRFNAMTCA
jgi:hypothetical protein